jgi:hypothetical protein
LANFAAGTIVRLAQDLLPQDLNLREDTHDLIQACALEFIQLLTFQANEICQRENRNGFLGLQHIVRACQELGFQEYVCEIEAVSAVFERQVKLLQKVCATETRGNGGLEEGGEGGLVGSVWWCG